MSIVENANSSQLSMVVRAYTKHLARHPLGDDEIREGLTYIKDMVCAVLDEPQSNAVVLHLHQHAEHSDEEVTA